MSTDVRHNPRSPADHRWLTQIAAAEYLGVTDRTIRNLISRGQLKARRIGNSRMIRIDRADLDALLRPIPTTGGDAS